MSLSALTIDCNDFKVRGGISRIFLIDSCDLTSFSRAVGTDHNFDTVVLTGSFVEFEFFEYTGSHTEETELGDKGQGVINHTLSFFIPKKEKVKAKLIQDLFNARKAIAVYEAFDDDGAGNAIRFVVGYDGIVLGKAQLTVSLESASGALLTEDNGYTLTMTGQGAETAREWTGTLADLGIT